MWPFAGLVLTCSSARFTFAFLAFLVAVEAWARTAARSARSAFTSPRSAVTSLVAASADVPRRTLVVTNCAVLPFGMVSCTTVRYFSIRFTLTLVPDMRCQSC